MRRTTAVLLNLVLLIFFLSTIGCSHGEAGRTAHRGSEFKLTVLHVNDTHSKLDEGRYKMSVDLGGGKENFYFFLGSYPRLVSAVNELSNGRENCLFLHAGDLVQGSLYYTKYHGAAGVELMNMAAPDAMVVGNHEFDNGPERLFNIINQADFPILGANVDASNDPFLNNRLPGFIIETFNGESVGIIGLVTPETEESSSPGDTIKFLDVEGTAADLVDELTDQGVDKIIVLSHQGYEADRRLARNVEGIDAIIGGHSHTFLGDFSALGLNSEGPYPTRERGPGGRLVCIGQVGKWALGVGVMDLAFDGEGRTVSCDGTPVLLASDRFLDKDKRPVSPKVKQQLLDFCAKTPTVEVIEQDEEALDRLEPFSKGLEEYKKKVLASIAEPLWHVRIPGDKNSQGEILAHGSMVSPLIAAGMLWKVNSVGLKVDVALDNAGDARISLPQGDLTVAGVYELLPFENTLVVLDVTGETLMRVLELSASLSQGSFLYPAGLRYSVDMNLPEGRRITKAEVPDSNDVFQPIDPNKTYRLVLNSYIGRGQGGFDLLNKSSIKKYDTGFVDEDVFQEYASKHSPVNALEPLVEYIPQGM